MIRAARTAPPRKTWAKWIRTEADRHAVAEGCYFDLTAAERVRTFFAKFLRHSSGKWAGKPFELLEWQWQDLIAPLYGWRQADGTRRYRRAFVEIPKKNGKSTICSGLSLYHLVADGEQGAEVYCAAADRQQAAIVYNEAAAMVEASPALLHRLELVKSQKRIVYFQTGSLFRALAADAGRNEGLKTSALIFDELHAQKNRALWDSLRWGGAAREQPLMLAITTAGWDRTSICYEQYQYAKGILEGRHFDSSFFAYIAEAEESDDWTDEKVWYKANPSLGQTISIESFRQDFLEAKQSPASENAFRRYRLNQWTEQEVRWLELNAWAKCNEDFDDSDLDGRACYAGLDMAATQDVCAFVLVFPMDDGSYRILPKFWAPAGANKKRERSNRARIDHWSKQGYITEHDGDEITFDLVRNDIIALRERYDIRKIAKDKWNSIQIGQQLTAEGFEIVDISQGKALSPAAKEFERLMSAGLLRHNDNPVLNWMAGNVTALIDANENVALSKSKSIDKIDGIVGAVMGIGLCMAEPIVNQIEEIRWG
jgi:phage terminase large subunit-like protein